MNMAEEKQPVKYQMKKKQKTVSFDELNSMSKEDLVDRIMKLESYNHQLKFLLKKKCNDESHVSSETTMKYDFERCPKRHVLLKFLYLGWDCDGYVTQENTNNTIEHHLFNALKKCCLIEDRKTSNYMCCGRTDKGVSAFSQVISIDLRSKMLDPSNDNCESELPYLTMLNRILPINIRCYAWAHVDSTISARFDCSFRTYHYYFPEGDLDISLMQEGLKHIIGIHDFRNLCKMNVANAVTEFVRHIEYAEILRCSSTNSGEGYQMYKLIIKSQSFLWHQIRYIVAVLLMVGQGKESPDIFKELLDVVKNPAKPQYTMANHTPLVLFRADYENVDVKWNTDNDELKVLMGQLQNSWTLFSIKGAIIKDAVDELATYLKEPSDIRCQVECLSNLKHKIHKPLLSRDKCSSLEDRVEHYIKKKKIEKC